MYERILTQTHGLQFLHIQVGNSRNSSASKAATRRAQEITSLLEKLCAVIDSRTDIMAGANVDAGIPSHDQLSSLLTTLPRPLHSPQAATEFVDRVPYMGLILSLCRNNLSVQNL